MKKLISLALSNLLEVDEQISRLSDVLTLDTESYYLHLYRIATCHLSEQSTELEIMSVRLLQSIVIYETVDLDDPDYEELRELLLKDVERKYKLLTWRA